ncbi:MAG: hypothetical protein HKN18_18430 [Silicimonas sp.]|nr:hypothetical protein [Silicimonas sp.]
MIPEADNLRSQGRCKINFIRITLALVAWLGICAPVMAEDLILRMPKTMLDAGFHKQILPRFKFKHRIAVVAVPDGQADMAFGETGTQVFQKVDGAVFKLDIVTEDTDAQAQAATFLKWLKSTSGKAAIEGFKPDGVQIYTTKVVAAEIKTDETFDGDKATGSRLALVHCGRCHVIDKRNRMGGIGSTPSFAALRGRENWSDLFRAFYVHNPHPSFTQVAGVTDPFDPSRQIHVAPVEITPEEIEAITAFVATLKPKQLGRPIKSN